MRNKGKKKKHVVNQQPWWYVEHVPKKKKKNRMHDSSCRYYLQGTCTYANKDCICHSFYCKRDMEPIRQLAEKSYRSMSSGKMRRNNVSLALLHDEAQKSEIVDFSKSMPCLHIYSGSLLATREYLADRGMILSLTDGTISFPIFVTYNTNTDTYYIAKEHLDIYYSRKMWFRARLVCADSKECTNPLADGDDGFDKMSMLSMYGYKVGKTKGLPAKDRHKIISFLIENGICSMSYLTSVLQFNIRLRENAYETYRYALQHWREDLEYIIDTFVDYY